MLYASTNRSYVSIHIQLLGATNFSKLYHTSRFMFHYMCGYSRITADFRNSGNQSFLRTLYSAAGQ